MWKIFLATLLLFSAIRIDACNCECASDTFSPEDLTQLYSDICEASQVDMDKAFELYKIARKVDPHFPVVEDLSDGFVLRNMNPEVVMHPQFQENYTRDMIRFGIVTSKEEIEFLPEGVFVQPQKKKLSKSLDDECWCKDNCDSLAFGLSWSCSMLRSKYCVCSCMATVESLRRTCKYCCEGTGFLQRCLWPLTDYHIPPCIYFSNDW